MRRNSNQVMAEVLGKSANVKRWRAAAAKRDRQYRKDVKAMKTATKVLGQLSDDQLDQIFAPSARAGEAASAALENLSRLERLLHT